ncbi:MAG: NAD-dependent deacetylase [Deltaproteobacteria bacterium]|nr:NAD-dependent deacetylase [Deltaproteobacteria bacterium]
MSADLEESIARARALIEGARRIVVLTGAGISTDSGIADFRGPQGLWTKNPEAEKMANIRYYMTDPEVRKRSWQIKLAGAEQERRPNAGHYALLELEKRDQLHTLITQNVDGLHVEAGMNPDRVIEIHGTLREVVCMQCDQRAPMESALERVRAGESDPPCRSCGGILKSATISFGQGLVAEDLANSEVAAKECDLMFAIGTTLGVYPIAGVVPIAHECGGSVIILNAEATEMDRLADVNLRGSISEVLPRVVGGEG